MGKAGLRDYVQALHASSSTRVQPPASRSPASSAEARNGSTRAFSLRPYLNLHHEPETDWQDELVRN